MALTCGSGVEDLPFLGVANSQFMIRSQPLCINFWAIPESMSRLFLAQCSGVTASTQRALWCWKLDPGLLCTQHVLICSFEQSLIRILDSQESDFHSFISPLSQEMLLCTQAQV